MPGNLGIIDSSPPIETVFSPPDLANLALWLDASDTASITDAGSGAVSLWNDLSGNARHFAQGTGANRPTTGTVTVNSLNAIDFDGSNDLLVLGAPISTAINNVSMFIVCKPDAAPAASTVPFFNGRRGYDGYGPAIRTNGSTVGWLQGGVAWRNGSSSAPSSGLHLLSLMRTSGTVSMRYDTVEEYSASIAFGTPSVEAIVGQGELGGGYFNGAICECIFYTAALGASDRQSVEDYLAAKWGGAW
jgi:hypothetical protein